MREFEIRDLETMKVLTHPVRIAILELLVEPATVTALAEELGVPRTRLYRHLHRLEKAGLVEAVQTRQVRGTTESSYRAVADRFVPAPELLSESPLHEVVEIALSIILDTTRTELGSRLHSGELSMAQSAAERTMSFGRQVLRLTAEQATELIDEMEAKVAQLAEDAGGDEEDTHPYVFQYVVHRGGGTLG